MSEHDHDDDQPMNPEAAREQEAEYFGVKTGYGYALAGGETWTLPFPRYLPPDMRMRYLEHLRAMTEDVDMQTAPHPVTGKTQKRPMFPLRMKSTATPQNPKGLIDEDALLCRALMGDATYEQFLAAGGVPGQIQARWQMMNRQMEERLKQDPQIFRGA